ncbi:hypothetical protein GCM10010400_61660 [Streptomyces aculeolatus]|uniref:hypothetical protein n=1 Tax=Streptomyces aculeolatus TaxID=270689 RepID=UPI001CED81EA|nr:hypothetical protein [Streptomyces aculeolatus]
MSRALTVDGLSVAVRALRLLAADFSHLPAPDVHVSTVFPRRLELSFHGDEDERYSFAAFEAWRDALGVDTGAVTFNLQADGRTRVLRVLAEYAGAQVELFAYAPVPELVGGAA